MFLRARYGHGGRLGYEKEWRADPQMSGGGELIDQGVHLIDLARWFLGDLPEVDGTATTSFWDMEIYGRDGKLQVDGLGGSYGTERLTWYRMLPQMGPPETTAWEYPMADDSWSAELAAFLDDIRQHRSPSPNLRDALAALRVVQRIYETSGHPHHA
jgi:predicted dehydrogenase